MTRIVAGTVGGRTLRTPTGRGTRPTSAKVRSALFDALDARGLISGERVLDLYAGSGALGLEAASRGAAAVTLVEQDRRAAGVIRENVAALGLSGIDVRATTVATALAGEPTAFGVVLLDPPYDLDEHALADVLLRLTQGWLGPHAAVVVERSTRSPEPTWPPGLAPERAKRYGETTVWFALGSGP